MPASFSDHIPNYASNTSNVRHRPPHSKAPQLRNGQLYSIAAQLQQLMPMHWCYSSSTCSIRPSLTHRSLIPCITLRSLQHADQFRPQYGPPSRRCSIQTQKAACRRRRCSMSVWRRVSERMGAFSERTDFSRYAKVWGIWG